MPDFYRFNTSDRDIKLDASDRGDTTVLSVDSAASEVLYDAASDTVSYVGWSVPGTAQSAAAWRIARLESDAFGNLTKYYADSDPTFTKQWTQRASYTYGA